MEQLKIRQANGLDGIVRLNVRGETKGFATSYASLTQVKDSRLAKMFGGDAEPPRLDGAIFVNRNPAAFTNLVDYLASDLTIPPMD